MALSDDVKTLSDNVAALTTAVDALVAAYQGNQVPPEVSAGIQAAAGQAAALTATINSTLTPAP